MLIRHMEATGRKSASDLVGGIFIRNSIVKYQCKWKRQVVEAVEVVEAAEAFFLHF